MTADISIIDSAALTKCVGHTDTNAHGASTQDRTSIVPAAGWSAEPALSVEPVVGVAVIYLDAPALIYVGPSDHDAEWEARAVAYPAGQWRMVTTKGDKVALKAL
ncbi:hypothetical protein M9M90_13195 [Phenylobacterium sp. LH3H17]|uniref:hypothetical protein n=1 Tax=Phenylobacterium sp. LH3H17 TaxID=2903901 RepID=UPI0020C959B8|nr:hypothetical protein [Phenylobacterium sp. LH3H17]UTP38173.1 hypothetical protein M9M90_13195 [Phenylobacterium sp. LH3H17]